MCVGEGGPSPVCGGRGTPSCVWREGDSLLCVGRGDPLLCVEGGGPSPVCVGGGTLSRLWREGGPSLVCGEGDPLLCGGRGHPQAPADSSHTCCNENGSVRVQQVSSRQGHWLPPRCGLPCPGTELGCWHQQKSSGARPPSTWTQLPDVCEHSQDGTRQSRGARPPRRALLTHPGPCAGLLIYLTAPLPETLSKA